jgi:hypothetical protein
MLRTFIIAALVGLSASALAQSDAKRGIRFGVGCIGPVSTFGPRLGACAVPDSKSRIWCPNGDVFDKSASEREPIPSSFVIRAICNLNQVL